MTEQSSPTSTINYPCFIEVLANSAKKGLIEKAFSVAADPMMIMDREHNIILANKAARQMCDEQDFIIGSKCWQVFHGGAASCDKPSEVCWFDKILKTGEVVKTVVPQSSPSGQIKMVSVTASPICKDNNELENIVVILRDISSEEKRDWENNGKIQQLMLEQCPDSLLTINELGDIVYVNETWQQVFGYEKSEVIDKLNMCDLTVEGQEQMCAQALSNLQAGKKVHCAEVEWVRKDGSSFWSRVRANPIKNQKGSTLSLISIRDLTEGSEVQEHIAESTWFIKALLDSLGEGVLIIDPEYRIIETNKKFLEISGTLKTDVLGKFCYKVSHDSDLACWAIEDGDHECPTKIAFETGKSASAIHIHKDDQKKDHFVEVKAFPLKDDQGEIFQVIETHTDITEKKNLQNKLAQAEKMQAIGTLAGGIAHDLNNVLTPIQGNAELALMQMSEEEPFRQEFEEIHESAKRASNLIRQILAFTRQQILQKKHVNMNIIIENLTKMLNRLIREDVALETSLEQNLWNIFADPAQLDQVIINLVVNARDAMPDGGKIIIETQNLSQVDNFCHTCGEWMSGDYVLVMLSDTGTGIDPQIMNSIFEPFFTTKEMGLGTGMGLSTVQGIMHQHNAHINYYSEQDLGTTFKIYFPRSEFEESDKLDTGQAKKALPRGNETILVVDDNDGVRIMIEKALVACGYTALSAENGFDAINVFKQHKKDIALLLTDIVMPGMGGKELAKKLWKIRPRLPVLFTSGYSLNAVHEQFVLKEDIEYIQKPVSIENLANKVRSVIDDKGN